MVTALKLSDAKADELDSAAKSSDLAERADRSPFGDKCS
jgi:hypothetical protein